MLADVCLVVEGSYPYVAGGVGTWVHQLIQGLPDVKFSLVTLLPGEPTPWQDKYDIPRNVVDRQDVFPFASVRDTGRRVEGNRALYKALNELHDTPTESRCPYFRTVSALMRAGGHTTQTLMTARSSWQFLRELYQRRNRDVSFLDYFWTWRAIHGPMFQMFDVEMPNAPVYHSVSTGYAGLLAARGKLIYGGRMMLTEHGLYTREREIEIATADWIYTEPKAGTAYSPMDRFFKGWWQNQFRFLGKLTYDMADRIVTLHEPNRRLQIQAGADPDRLSTVPNGIPTERYEELRHPRDWQDRPFRVALVGRVVPIKDIKTFIRAVQLASLAVPIEAYILGPTDEDPAYYEDCQELVRLLHLEKTITFTGQVDMQQWLPKIDLNVLTSVSESQPLAIMEAAAAGVPTVSSDVGACQELLEGRAGEDALLGPSGIITPIASPQATAAAIVSLAQDPERYARFAVTGIERIERYYQQSAVFAAYESLYRELQQPAAARA